MNNTELELIQQYHHLQSDLIAWGEFVDSNLVETILGTMQQDIKIPPKFRLKEQRSLLDKAFYRNRRLKNPLKEIVDKVATRVVFLKSDDVSNARDLICNSTIWHAVLTKNTDDEIKDMPKVFDYQSIHIVVYPLKGAGFDNQCVLGCEIQLRTLLQHAFAEVSHDNIYKGVYKNDPYILRQLSKSMALMEATDDYFSKVYEIMIDESRVYPAFLNDLKTIFKEFVPAYKDENIDISLNDHLLGLFRKRPVTIQEVETCIQKRIIEFRRAIKISNGYLFQQPISILVGYYLLRDDKFLNENWPIDGEILSDVYRAFNVSQTHY